MRDAISTVVETISNVSGVLFFTLRNVRSQIVPFDSHDSRIDVTVVHQSRNAGCTGLR